MNVKECIESRINWTERRNIKIAPRDPYLQSIQGTYKVHIPPKINRRSELAHYLYTYFGYDVRCCHRQLPCSHSNCTCWASWAEWQKVDNLEVPSEVIEVLNTGMIGRLSIGKFFRRIYRKEFNFDLIESPAIDAEITVSCRYKDILKCSDSRNYESCFRKDGLYQNVPVQYLSNPGVAIAYIRDKSGKFSSRVFLYLGTQNEILIGRPYGVIDDKRVWQTALSSLNAVIQTPNTQAFRRKFVLKYKEDFSYTDIFYYKDDTTGEQYTYV